jgi:endonuclease G
MSGRQLMDALDAAASERASDVMQALEEAADAQTRTYYDQERDDADRESYFKGIDDPSQSEAFFFALHDLLESSHHTQPDYKPMLEVYPWVDLQPDLRIRSLYSGEEYTVESLIERDYEVFNQRLIQAQTRMVEQDSTELDPWLVKAEDLLPYNCEHVVPQSWFDKQEPMRGDLHHLFACEARCNSFRSNIPYFDYDEVKDAGWDSSLCGRADRSALTFEPKNGKGAAARATLYFITRYPGEVNAHSEEYQEERIQTLIAWHLEEEPELWELHRNAAIYERQGNRNPFIDHAEWAEKIDFRHGLG